MGCNPFKNPLFTNFFGLIPAYTRRQGKNKIVENPPRLDLMMKMLRRADK